MKLRFLATAVVVLSTLLAGCATKPQLPIGVSSDLLASKSSKIAVVMTPLPKVDTEFPGAGCLLCLAAAALTNQTLTAHVQTLTTEELPQLPAEVVKVLRARGLDATVISAPLDLKQLPDGTTKEPNFAHKDFSSLKAKYNVDKLLVVEIRTVGVWRNYANYIPAGEPRAVLKGSGYIVNLNNNALEWFAPLDIAKPSDGPWDEPPKFPGLTNAYFQAIDSGREAIIKAFVP